VNYMIEDLTGVAARIQNYDLIYIAVGCFDASENFQNSKTKGRKTWSRSATITFLYTN